MTTTALVTPDAIDCRGVVYYGRDVHQPAASPGAERIRRHMLTRLAAGEVEERDVPHRPHCRCIR